MRAEYPSGSMSTGWPSAPWRTSWTRPPSSGRPSAHQTPTGPTATSPIDTDCATIAAGVMGDDHDP